MSVYMVPGTLINNLFGTSLVVQWVRLRVPNEGAWVRSLVGELDPACMPQLRVHMPQLRSPHVATKSLHAATEKSTCCN